MTPPPRQVEFRSYQLKPGTRDVFHRLVHDQVMPLLHAWPMDVVRCGPSTHDADSYVLVRAYADLEAREREQDGFYASPAWVEGPRAAVLSMIQNYLSVVLPLDAAAVDALREETSDA